MLYYSFIVVVVVIVLVIYLVNYISLCVRRYYFLTKLPGPLSKNFIFGSLMPFYTTPGIKKTTENIFKIKREWGKKYYPLYHTTAMHLASSNIVNPNDCELIMNNMKHIKKSVAYKVLHEWLGSGLLTSTGNKWQKRRKMLTPTFHFRILEHFVIIFNEETDQLVNALKKQCHKPYIAINDIIALFTLKSITETSMGIKLQLNNTTKEEYHKSIFELGKIIIYKTVHPWLLIKPLYMLTSVYYKEKKVLKILHRFTNRIIVEKEKTFNSVSVPLKNNNITVSASRKKYFAMLDLLLATKQEGNISYKGIQEEVDTFLFEAHDTTAAALNFVFMILACRKDVQSKIIEEMLEVLGDFSKRPTLRELQQMKFLERCIKEVLRLYPSVPVIARELSEDIMTNSGYLLPKGSITNIHIYDIHHNPEIYPDPEKFDPDRFLPENIKNRNPFAFIPFSAGPRNCIGQKFAIFELKSAVCGVLANFVLEPIDTPETIELLADLILRTKNDIKIKFIPRF